LKAEIIEALKQVDGPSVRVALRLPTGLVLVVKLFSLDQPDWTVEMVSSEEFYDMVKAHWPTQEQFDANSVRNEIESVLKQFSASAHTRVVLSTQDPSAEEALDRVGALMGRNAGAYDILGAISAFVEGVDDVYDTGCADAEELTKPEGIGETNDSI
jgi:hypothetical protein